MRKTITAIAILALSAFALNRTLLAEGTPVGQAAPPFSAQDQNGKPVALSDYAGKIIVLEWLNPDCPFVQRHAKDKTMQSLADKYKDKDVVWIGINSSRGATNAIDAEWIKENRLTYPVLNDASSKIARAYGAKATPHMFIIDKTGRIVYQGAIDNDRDANKTTDKVNYVDQALSQILAGKTVSVPETQAYGCGVKYRD